MARTLSTTETKVYAAGHMTVPLQVWIKDGTSTWVELTDLEGHNFVRGVEIGADIDDPVESATIDLEPSVYDFKLSPLYEASKINHPSGGLEERIKIGREVAILSAILPKDSAEPAAASGWRLIFSGDVVALDIAGMSLRCVDKGGRLQRRKLERAGQPESSPGGGSIVHGGDPYIAVGATVAAETLMQSILDDWASPAVTLSTPISPGWVLTETWSQSNPPEGANILDVLRSIASMIGWDVRYRFDATATDPFGVTAGAGGVGNYTLQFYEPDRSNTTPDITLGADDYHSVGSLVNDVATIANRVEVFYKDDPNPDVTELRSVLAEDATSQTAYGTLYMRVRAEDIPGITTEALADTLAAAILNDVVDPRAEMTAEAIYLYHVELFDLIRFSANGEHFDSSQDLAVVGWRHHFDDGGVTTSLTLSGTIKGHRGNYWLAGLGVDQTVNGYDLDVANGAGHSINTGSTSQPNTPDLTHDVTLNGFRLKVASLPLDFSHIEWHIDTSGSGFTPSSSTLVALTAGDAYVANDLTQGTTHYAKAITVSAGGVKSAASTAITALPGTTLAKLEVQEAFGVTISHSDGQPYALVIDRTETNHITNPSLEVNTSGWTADAGLTFTRDTTTFAWGAACGKLVNTTAASRKVESNTAAANSGEYWSSSVWMKGNAGGEVVTLSQVFDAGPTDSLTVTLTTEWRRYTISNDGAALGGTTTVKLRISSTQAVTWFFDAAQMEHSPTPSSYFDGSFAAAGFAWTGTAHASASTRTGSVAGLGPIAADSPPFIVYDDGEVSCGPITPSAGTAAEIGQSGAPLQIAGGGSSFPAAASDGDVFFRTDRGILYYYDAANTRWLSVEEYVISMSPYGQFVNALAATGTALVGAIPSTAATTIYLTKWVISTSVATTNTSPNSWIVGLSNSAATGIDSFDTTGDGVGTVVRRDRTVNSVRTVATDKYLYHPVTKGGTAGNLSIIGSCLHYRLIG